MAAAAAPEQIILHYAGPDGTGSLSVDWVSTTDKTGSVAWGTDGGSTFPNVYPSTTSFAYDTIGFLHQGFINSSSVAVGQVVSYKVGSDAVSLFARPGVARVASHLTVCLPHPLPPAIVERRAAGPPSSPSRPRWRAPRSLPSLVVRLFGVGHHSK